MVKTADVYSAQDASALATSAGPSEMLPPASPPVVRPSPVPPEPRTWPASFTDPWPTPSCLFLKPPSAKLSDAGAENHLVFSVAISWPPSSFFTFQGQRNHAFPKENLLRLLLLPSPSCPLESDLQQLLVSPTVDRAQLRRLLVQKSSQRGFLIRSSARRSTRRWVGQASLSWLTQTIGIICAAEKPCGIE